MHTQKREGTERASASQSPDQEEGLHIREGGGRPGMRLKCFSWLARGKKGERERRRFEDG